MSTLLPRIASPVDLQDLSDEQLTQAIDVLRGLSLIAKRAAG